MAILDKEVKFDFYTKTRKRRKTFDTPEEAYEESIEEWIAFWRENPHRFAQDYLQVRLKDFQEIVLYEMSKNTNTIIIATRGLGKTFLTSLYACIMAILYPNSKIVIVCGVKAQAKSFISEKIEKELLPMSVMLRQEIKEIKTESEMKTVIFKNGSTISATNAHENRRGIRATMLIVDEAVQVDKRTLESVCKPFLNTKRHKGYENNPRYRRYTDKFENQTLYLTSAWYKAHYFYTDYYTHHIKKMLANENSKVFNFSYETSVRCNLLSEDRVEEQRETSDEMTFQMEMESIFYGENGNSFFKADEINNCRTLTNVYHAPTEFDAITYKMTGVYKYALPKAKNEIRILSSDIAISGGKARDNSVYSVLSLRKVGQGYHIKLLHMVSYNGVSPEEQAILIKRLFYETECNRCIIDANGIGYSVYTELKKVLFDCERDVTYPAWGDYFTENVPAEIDLYDREWVLYGMKATIDSNHKMIMELKSDLIAKRIELPVNDVDARYYLEEKYNYSSLSGEEQAQLIQPFRETNLFFRELVDLNYAIVNGKVKVFEDATSRKDRFSSVAYGVYLAHILIDEMTKEIENTDVIFLT